MDPLEEQQQELEVLESIYPDEFLKESDTKFSITIKLDTPSDRVHALLLEVEYPPEYPEVIPLLGIELGEIEQDEDDQYDEDNNEDEDDDDDDTKAAKKALNMSETIDFGKEEFKFLLEKLTETAEILIGMPMVFALTSQLQEDAESLFQEILNTRQSEYDKQLVEREKKEQQKFIGTPVTKESFSRWRELFRAELKLEENLIQRFNDMHQGKMTGREIFEKGLAGDEEEELEEGFKKVAV